MSQLKQIFLRSCINHGCLTVNKADALLLSLSEACEVSKPNIKELVNEINGNISQYNQKLTFCKHPLAEGSEFLVFGLTFETEVCKLQMHYTDADRYYFLRLIEATVTNEDFGISWVNIYNVLLNTASSAEKKLTKQRMQELVQNWTRQGYFLEKGDILYFGPRMLVEYGTHFKMNYSDFVEDCPLCKTLVLWDVKCGECGIKVHRECIRKYLIRKSVCPSCNKTWNTRLSLTQLNDNV